MMIKDIEKYELRVCSYYFEYPDIKKIKPQKYDEEKTENETIEIMKDDFITLYSRQLLNLVWNKIYYANIIKENNILFVINKGVRIKHSKKNKPVKQKTNQKDKKCYN